MRTAVEFLKDVLIIDEQQSNESEWLFQKALYQEKRQIINAYDAEWDEKIKNGTDYYYKTFTNHIENEKHQFAIDFLKYYHNNLFFIPLKKGEAEKILEKFKYEKE